MNIESEKLRQLENLIDQINEADLMDLKIDGVPIIDLIEIERIDNWKYTGLSNYFFIVDMI